MLTSKHETWRALITRDELNTFLQKLLTSFDHDQLWICKDTWRQNVSVTQVFADGPLFCVLWWIKYQTCCRTFLCNLRMVLEEFLELSLVFSSSSSAARLCWAFFSFWNLWRWIKKSYSTKNHHISHLSNASKFGLMLRHYHWSRENEPIKSDLNNWRFSFGNEAGKWGSSSPPPAISGLHLVQNSS